MKKPDWEDAPHWANYLVECRGGIWKWSDVEPYWSEDEDDWLVLSGRFIDTRCVFTRMNTPERRPLPQKE
jgi:hypothetical protein